jgi:hypothetical protein
MDDEPRVIKENAAVTASRPVASLCGCKFARGSGSRGSVYAAVASSGIAWSGSWYLTRSSLSTTGQTITIIASLFAALGVQTVWIVHALTRLDVHLSARLDRLDRVEIVLREHGERIARLEPREARS